MGRGVVYHLSLAGAATNTRAVARPSPRGQERVAGWVLGKGVGTRKVRGAELDWEGQEI